jgi:replication initiation and membrane attachment protein DnaB
MSDYALLFSKIDSFKRLSKIKSHIQFEVDFLPTYAQKERNLSEFNLLKMVRGRDLNPRTPPGWAP